MEDLERLLKAVRRHIEFDDSVSAPLGVEDGEPGTSSSARRIRFFLFSFGLPCSPYLLITHLSFLPSLIPPTPETLNHVLVQGGLPFHLISVDDPAFVHLVAETRAFISSADFGRVLETSLDHATDMLLEGLRRSLFTDNHSVDTSSCEKIRLAGLLPGVARWCHSAIHGTPNELVEVRSIR